MTSSDLGIEAPAPSTILAPYTADPKSSKRKWQRRLIMAFVIGFCLFYGLAFAYLAPFLMLAFAFPLAVLLVVLIWALPDSRNAPLRTLSYLMFAFQVGLVMWPAYLAIAIPGLPWFTLLRLIGAPFVLVLLICVSTSATLRSKLSEVLRETPLLWKLTVAFSILQLLSIGVSSRPFFSFDKFVADQFGQTAMFFACAYLFVKPGRAERWMYILWSMSLPIGLIAIAEWRARHVLWAGHIPSFLVVEDEILKNYTAGGGRSYTTIYRAQATYGNALGLAEFFALTLPFVLHVLSSNFSPRLRLLAFLSVPFLFFTIFVSGSRLGMIGFFMTLLFYLFYWGYKRWAGNKSSLMGPAIVLSYPVVAGGFLTATFFIGRLNNLIWGGGETKTSTDARIDQYNMGIPKFLSHPWGYGVGRAAETLNYHVPGGLLTIDTYYLVVLLEYGIVGVVIYYGLMAAAMYYSARYSTIAPKETREYGLLVPIASALANFFVIKSVFSQPDNHPLVFMMLGMTAALVYRIRQDLPALRKTTVAPAPARS